MRAFGALCGSGDNPRAASTPSPADASSVLLWHPLHPGPLRYAYHHQYTTGAGAAAAVGAAVVANTVVRPAAVATSRQLHAAYVATVRKMQSEQVCPACLSRDVPGLRSRI